jgi:hypothetical protein
MSGRLRSKAQADGPSTASSARAMPASLMVSSDGLSRGRHLHDRRMVFVLAANVFRIVDGLRVAGRITELIPPK